MRASDRRRAIGATLLLLATVCGASPAAAQKDDLESRLRAALRNATVQLRDLEDQNAALQAKQAQAERERLALTQKLAAEEQELEQLRQRAKAGEEGLQQAATRLQAANEAIETGRGAVAKLQAAYQETVDAVRARDAEAKRLDASLADMRKRTLSCEAKNGELYKLGREILDLYDKKGILAALGTGEPITALKRVELENLVQDYQDKLSDNRIVRPAQ